jgi:hypothetical protein
MILALLLAAAPLPDPATDYAAYERFTHREFRCDDRPYSKGCGNEAERRRLVRSFMRDVGNPRAHRHGNGR